MAVFSMFNWLGARPYWLSLIFTCLLIVWMASGEAKQAEEQVEEQQESALVKVQAKRINTETIQRIINLYGRTEPNRITTVKAEVSGKLETLHAERGSTVELRQKIGTIEVNDKKQQLLQARSLLKQRDIELKGSESLAKQGYQGKVRLAEAKASRDLASAMVKQLELAVKKTQITAPYHGVLNERFVEVGDYVAIGDPIATISDIDPIIVTTSVTEKDISSIRLGQDAWVELIDKQKLKGKVRYISSLSDPASNTFKVEVELANPKHVLLGGMSARVSLPLNKVEALKVTPALLALDDTGVLGVKTLENNIVGFTPIKMIRSDDEGIWLSGFSKQAELITVGQGFVKPGDKVIVQYESELEKGKPNAESLSKLQENKVKTEQESVE